jgi:tetratricopeptide (TPR) repeat protein
VSPSFSSPAISTQALGRYPEAIHDCNSAIDNDPNEYAAWFNKGNVEMRTANYSVALSDYQRAADLAPGIAGYRLRAATVLFQVIHLT